VLVCLVRGLPSVALCTLSVRCARERQAPDVNVSKTTSSLWTYVLSHARDFTNKLYKRPPHMAVTEAATGVGGAVGVVRSMDPGNISKHAVIPSADLFRMRVWRLYHRLWV
jgi:hypothetical protein